jgi:hypothetical protein
LITIKNIIFIGYLDTDHFKFWVVIATFDKVWMQNSMLGFGPSRVKRMAQARK